MSTTPSTYYDIDVCVDCYFAHHYGHRPTSTEGGWLVGPDFSYPKDRTDTEPLSLVRDAEISDNTDSDTEEGMTTFTWSTCQGCGSTLGGARYRLAVHERS